MYVLANRGVMRNIALVLLSLLLMAGLNRSLEGAVFQFAVPVKVEKGNSSAFLWIPPQAKQVRGVIMAGTTVAEKELSKDPVIRKACADQQIAIVLLKCGLAATDLQVVLDDLAKASGYGEISVAPLVFIGHSAGGPQAQQMAVKYADRCFGLMQYRGGGPYDGKALPPGIPTLTMMGEFDEYGGVMRRTGGTERWDSIAEALGKYNAAEARNIASLVVEPGAGHFSWSDRNAAYLAMFITRSAATRIPPSWPIDSTNPPKLLDIDVTQGWLTPLDLRSHDHATAVTADGFTGDRAKMAWHFDQAMAEATLKYHGKEFAKKDQFIKWDDGYWVDAGTRYFFNSVKWIGDGQSFEVHPAYAAAYPQPQPNNQGPKWLQAGQAVGHSSAPIRIKPVVGPIVATGPNTLRIQFDNISPISEGLRINFMAYSEGDAEFRYTEQVGMTPRGMKGLTGGKPQTITFPPLSPITTTSEPADLKATSDSGLKVEFYVAKGPADVVDGKLVLRDVPARAKLPIEVTVVAYQFGSGVNPQVKGAEPVEQAIAVDKP